MNACHEWYNTPNRLPLAMQCTCNTGIHMRVEAQHQPITNCLLQHKSC